MSTSTTTITFNPASVVTNNLTAPTAPANPGPQATWDGAVIAISAYNTGSGTASGYQQTLQPLSFNQGVPPALEQIVATTTMTTTGSGSSATTKSSTNYGAPTALPNTQTTTAGPCSSDGTRLAPGQSDTLTLATAPGSAPGAGSTTTPPGGLFDLIFAQPDNGFPVQSVGTMPLSLPGFGASAGTSKMSYPPITLTSTTTANEPSPCVNAWLFYQEINANPSSQLAQQFAQVGNSINQNASSSANIDSAIAGFFQGTKDYQNVTLAAWELVSSYLATFATPWANFQSSYTYYLTKPPAKPNDSGKAGRIVFERSATDTPSLILPGGSTNAMAGYTITYYDSWDDKTDGALSLYFSNGQLVSDPDADIPSVCLALNYASLSSFSQQQSDWGRIVPTLAGTFEGTQVMGVSWKPSDDEDDWQKAGKAIDKVWGSTGMKVFMAVTAFMMSIQLVFSGCAWIYKKLKGKEKESGEPATAEEVTEAHTELQERQEQDQTAAQENANRLGEQPPQVPDGGALQAEQQAFQKQLGQDDAQAGLQVQQKEVELQEQQIEAEASVSVNQNLENQAVQVQNEAVELGGEKPGDQNIKQELGANQQAIAGEQAKLNVINQQDSAGFNAQEKQENAEAEDAVKTVEEEKQKTEEEEQQKREGDPLEDEEAL